MWRNARRFLVAAILMQVSLSNGWAQRPGGGGPPPGGGMPGGPREMGGMPNAPAPNSQPNGGMGTFRGGLQFGPSGRWWDDKHFVKSLHITPEQKKRMDTVFDANRA